MNNGFEWSELTFTRREPKPADLVGRWVPTNRTLRDMKVRGRYKTGRHELLLAADGTCTMVDMPDWWVEGDDFGASHRGFVSRTGTWHIFKDHNVYTIWNVELGFPESPHALLIHLRREKPPYLMHMTLGDPDSGNYMLFEKAPG